MTEKEKLMVQAYKLNTEILKDKAKIEAKLQQLQALHNQIETLEKEQADAGSNQNESK